MVAAIAWQRRWPYASRRDVWYIHYVMRQCWHVALNGVAYVLVLISGGRGVVIVKAVISVSGVSLYSMCRKGNVYLEGK